MPYYRRRTYRRPYRKYRKSFRTYRKKWGKSRQGMGAYGKRFFKLRHTEQMIASGAGLYVGRFMNDPTVYQDWTSIDALFDTYKVCAMKLKFIPDKPNDTSTTTGYRPIYVVGDSDDTSALTSVNQAIEYENMKAFDLSKPWSYYFKLPKRTQIAATTTIVGNGYQDTSVTTASAAIKMYSSGLDISDTYGQFIVTIYVCARNRV